MKFIPANQPIGYFIVGPKRSRPFAEGLPVGFVYIVEEDRSAWVVSQARGPRQHWWTIPTPVFGEGDPGAIEAAGSLENRPPAELVPTGFLYRSENNRQFLAIDGRWIDCPIAILELRSLVDEIHDLHERFHELIARVEKAALLPAGRPR